MSQSSTALRLLLLLLLPLLRFAFFKRTVERPL